MSFGAIVASGSDNKLLSDELAECLIEVRVEQTLDEPTRFGIRVREDLSGGEPMAARSAELRPERILTIAVPRADGLICLVRGPITEAQSQYTLGGPGSWYEVHGADRRVEMARQSVQAAWTGRASDAARQIAQSNGFTPDVQATDRQYSSTQTLNQRGTDLDFLKTMARENGFFFWISYTASLAGLPRSGVGSLQVQESANFKTSPFRALGAGGLPASIAGLQLAPMGNLKIRAGAGGDCGNNVTSFNVREEMERPTTATVGGVDDLQVRSERSSASDPQSPLASGGRTLTSNTSVQRGLSVTAPGTAQDAQMRAQAALADAGWFLTAHANTTAHMLRGVVQPHEVVEIEGIGSRHSIPFRVKKVTHVITASDHYMDVELQSNSHLER